jgi:hypothetical protein
MKTMTDTYQKVASSNQRNNLISATITDSVANWTASTGTLPSGNLNANSSARNVNFATNAVAGSGDGTKVLTAMCRQPSSGTGLSVYVRLETDFNGFSNISSWTQIWTSTTAIQINGGKKGNYVTAHYHENLNWWVVSWYVLDTTTSSSNNQIFSMWSSDGTTWNNWDSAPTAKIVSFAGSYGTTTPTGVSLATVNRDMTKLGYAGSDIALLIVIDQAIVNSAGSNTDGRKVYILHHINSFWDTIVYTWNNGPIYNCGDIAATYVSGSNQINVLLSGTNTGVTTGATTNYLWGCYWNAEVAPTNFSKLEILAGKDISLTTNTAASLVYQKLSLQRYIYSNDPDVQWTLGLEEVNTDANGVLTSYQQWSRSLEWGNWSNPLIIESGDNALNTIFFDNTNQRYFTVGTDTCRVAPVGATADLTADVLSYSRTEGSTGNAGTLSLVVNNLDGTAGGAVKWYSEGGDSTPTNTNYVTNPSFETNTTSWSGFNCTISRDTTKGYPSGNSLLVTSNTGGGAVYDTTYTLGKTYTAQARVKGRAGDQVYFSARSNGSSAPYYLTGNWDIISWTFTPTTASSSIEIKGDVGGQGFVSNNYNIDQVMLEIGVTPSAYFDGASGSAQYAWTGTANASTSTYAANYQPRTGTNASAIKKNSLITIKEGFVTSAGNEIIQVGKFYIDDVAITTSRGKMDLTISGRDSFKRLKNFVTTENINWQSQVKFNEPFTDNNLGGNWTSATIPGQPQTSSQWTESAGILTIQPTSPTVLTYNSPRPIENGVIQCKIMSTGWNVIINASLPFRIATTDSVMTWYEMSIEQGVILLSYYESVTATVHYFASTTTPNFTNGVWYWFKVIFNYGQLWGYYSTDGNTWISLFGGAVAIPAASVIAANNGPTQTEGLVGIVASGFSSPVPTLSFDDYRIYDLTPDQTIEGVTKSVAAKGQVFRTEFDSTLATGFQNQLKNSSFEGYTTTTSSTINPGAGYNDSAVGSTLWSNPGNITASDSVYATNLTTALNQLSNRLWAENFGFSIPTNATITGITATVKRNVNIPVVNLISNTGFETNTTGWVAESSATIARSTTTVHSGTGSLQVTTAATTSGAMYTGSTPAYVGQLYTLTCWVWVATGKTAYMGMWNNDGRQPIGATYITGNSAWQQITVSGLTTTTASTVNLYYRSSAFTTGIATMYLDDLVLSAGVATGTNLLYPSLSDFESTASITTDGFSWVQLGTTTITRDTTTFHSGLAALKCVTTAGNTGIQTTSGQVFPSYVGQTFTWSVWVKGTAAIGLATQVFQGATVIGGTSVPVVDGTWQFMTCTATAINTTQSMTYNVFAGGADTFYVDDVSLTTTPVVDAQVYLIKGNTVQTTASNRANTLTAWPLTDSVATYGSSTDLWNNVWTPADINASNFGLAIAAQSLTAPGATLSVDNIQMAVTYQLPSQPSTANWTLVNSNGAASTFTTDSTTSAAGTGATSALINITTPTATATDVTFTQSTRTITNGTKYIASFYAKAETARMVQLTIKGSSTHLAATSFNLSTQWQRFSAVFTGIATEINSVNYQFNLNNNTIGKIWVDGCQLESLAPGSTQTSPSVYDDAYGRLGTAFGTSPSYSIVDANTFGDALNVNGTSTTYGYVPINGAIPADFRLDFSTRLYQTGNLGTAGRVVYRNNSVASLGSGYVFEFGTPTNSSNWYSPNWQFRKSCVINNGQITGLVPWYTFTLDLSLLGSQFWANVRSDGADVLITDSDGTTKLPREIANFNKTSKTGTAYFTAATNAVNTGARTYYAYYGNSSGAETNSTLAWGNGNVTHYGVYHLEEDPTGTAPQAKDSSASGNNLSATGTFTSAALVAGVEGKGVKFSGSNGYAQSGTATYPANTIGIECWVNIPTTSESGAFAYIGNAATTNGIAIGVGNTTLADAGNHFIFLAEGVNWVNTSINIGTGTHHVAISLGTTSFDLYIDGVYKGNFATAAPTAGNKIAIAEAPAGGRNWHDLVDEVYISVNRTADWYATRYNNQRPTGNVFWTIQQQEFFGFSDWELKRIDDGVITPIGGKNPNTFQLSVSNSQSPSVWNNISIIANGPWHTIIINSQVVLSVYDNTYLSSSSGSGYLILGSGMSNQLMYYDNLRIPQMWQPVPSLTMSPSNDGQTVIDSLLSSTGASYWIAWDGRLKARKLQASDPLVWAFSSDNLLQNNYAVSDKEYINHSITYGLNRIKGDSYDVAGVIAAGEHRAHVANDEKLSNQGAVTDRASLDLQLAQAFLKQPDPSVIANPGLEIYDVINLSDPRIGLQPANYRVTSINTTFDASKNSLDQELGVTKVTGL